jgi:hypothetical protein
MVKEILPDGQWTHAELGSGTLRLLPVRGERRVVPIKRKSR